VLQRCGGCGLIYSNVVRTPEELDALYSRHYYSVANTLEGSAREEEQARNRVLYATVLSDVLRRYPQLVPRDGVASPRVLDWGCGPGYFLAECRRRGFDVLGVELSETAARYAQERLELDVRTAPEEALEDLSPGGFELVTAWAVLEHAQRPRELLTGLVRALAPGGVLCLSVPNLRCWRYLLEGARWFNMRNPTHLSFFSRAGLVRLLGELGLEQVMRPVFWGGRPGFGPVANLTQYFARAANLGSDLRLYARKPD
jgi:2-polyprenyl-3-methyl-5-hydroxy-6-metoxy-1,4-benzoquinol methylase